MSGNQSTIVTMAVSDPRISVTIYFKNKLGDRAAELINSRKPVAWSKNKIVLEIHSGNPRDLI